MTEYNGGSAKAEHLCVLVHGLWGVPDHLSSVAAALRAEFSEDQLHLLVAESNSGYFTYDGIETGGERVCLEIEDALAAAEALGARITKISVIGYSLGGLVARYAVGLLHAKGVLAKLECMNFTAFASPFLGVRSPVRGALSTIFNVMGARTLSMSGRQLFGIDTFRDTGRPLLAVLADPDSIFMAGLRRFRRRTLYANIVNDRSAVYYTTAIDKTDPYSEVVAAGGELEDLPLNFVPGYGDVLLDPKEPIARDYRPSTASLNNKSKLAQKQKNTEKKTPVTKALRLFLSKPWSREARAALLEAAPVLAFAFLLPLGVTWFLLNAVYQTAKSSRRRQLHAGGPLATAYGQLPLWMKGLRDARDVAGGAYDGAYEAIGSVPENEFLTESESDEDDLESIAQAEVESTKGQQARAKTHRSTPSDPQALSQQQLQGEAAHQHKHTLALAPEQFAMIEALNGLGWRKYRVWIHQVRHSHAAIVVRHDSPRFEEGRTVLRHFVKEEFLI